MNLAIIVLAAGKGTRMASDLAKVLHPLCGKPLVAWVLEAVSALQPQRIVAVVGHQAAEVERQVRQRFPAVEFARQEPMLGTGHAVQQAHAALRDFNGDIIVIYGDTPLISEGALRQLVQKRAGNAAAAGTAAKTAPAEGALASMMVAVVEEPGAYGRVLCEADGRVSQIVEAKDATPEILALNTVNAGTYCFEAGALWHYLAQISNDNRSGEYYLTDVVGLMTRDGRRVEAVFVDEREMTGINTRAQLQQLEQQLEDEARAA